MLSPHYYRDNFAHLCATVEAQYGDLLAEQELDFLCRFKQQSFATQCLYVRLVSRVGPWFRESRLAYPELGAVEPLIEELLESDLACCATTLDVDEIGRLYTRDELLRTFDIDAVEARALGKPQLLETIDALQLADGKALSLLAKVDPGRVIAAQSLEVVELLQLLFFGNRRQSLTEFVLSDLGVAQYYSYPLDREHRLFANREALDEYLDCSLVSDHWYALRECDALEELPDLAQLMLSMEVSHGSSLSRWHRLCNSVARQLERQDEGALALRLYQISERHPARERRARIMEAQANWQAAKALCDDILADPWCEAEAEAAARILPRVQRALDGTRSRRRRDAFATTQLLLPNAGGSVERQVAQRLEHEWAQVHYVENKLMNALFGLAFWDAIFAPVPGVFHNPFQSVPTDMYDARFRRQRRSLLSERLASLKSADLSVELPAAYARYAPYQCRWVDWRRIDQALVAAAATVIPAPHLLAIWERMLFDPGENRRGFPDLLALGDTPGEYRLIEVKAPGDALQYGQKRWLRFFSANAIPAEVAWVEWLDA